MDADGDQHFAYHPQLCPQGDDCNDSPSGGSAQHPGLTEICNDTALLDENCNGFSNCEDPYCWAGQTPQCDEQCDQDNDGFYKATCGVEPADCHDDDPLSNPDIPREDSGSDPDIYCSDGHNNDCDAEGTDCVDPDCQGYDVCQPPPTPPPFPTPTPPSSAQCEPPFGGSFCPSGTSYDTSSGLCCPSGGSGSCDLTWLEPQCAFNIGEYCACREFAGIWENEFCSCWAESPVIIDVDGDGFDLTNAANGVSVDMRGDGTPDELGWTAPGADDSFLVFDRNGNGNIDNGRELFGNITPQPSHPQRNGFLALAEYDKPSRGGNNDGRMTRHDLIFEYLRLWHDANHNGVSELSELSTLPQRGLRRIDLDYRTSERVDGHGNAFRYRAEVRDNHNAQLGRWAWDVFLVNENSVSRSIFVPERLAKPMELVCPD